jgi:hypothetical protein
MASVAEELNLNFDPSSPRSVEAWAEAQRLVAARLGGIETYTEVFNERFAGPRSMDLKSVLYLLYLADALVLLSQTLVVLATDARYEDILEEVEGDPQALLALIDNARDRMERGEDPGESAE